MLAGFVLRVDVYMGLTIGLIVMLNNYIYLCKPYMMNYKLILILCLLTGVCSAQNKRKEQKQSLSNHTITLKDTSKYVVFKYDSAEHSYYFDKVLKSSTLSNSELWTIEKLIREQTNKYSKAEAAKYEKYNKKGFYIYNSNSIKDPGKYRKQLIAIINKKGEKEVWVNGFCSDEPYWKQGIVLVNGGGICYFHLKANLTRNKVLYFGVNGII
jgi:hypothetical protein